MSGATAHNLDMAWEVSSEVVESFSRLHPGVSMTWQEWQDLREMIQREVYGLLSDARDESRAKADDLVDDANYLRRRRTALPPAEALP